MLTAVDGRSRGTNLPTYHAEAGQAREHAGHERGREHRRTHGRDPPLSTGETLMKVFCCRRPKEYDIQVIDSKRPSITSAIEALEKKKAIMEGGKKKRDAAAEDD